MMRDARFASSWAAHLVDLTESFQRDMGIGYAIMARGRGQRSESSVGERTSTTCSLTGSRQQ